MIIKHSFYFGLTKFPKMPIDFVEQYDGEEGLDYHEYAEEAGGEGGHRVDVA